jgi:hypothetical protein
MVGGEAKTRRLAGGDDGCGWQLALTLRAAVVKIKRRDIPDLLTLRTHLCHYHAMTEIRSTCGSPVYTGR